MLRLVTISQTNKLIKYMTIYSVQSDRQTTALCFHVVHSSVRPSVRSFVCYQTCEQSVVNMNYPISSAQLVHLISAACNCKY